MNRMHESTCSAVTISSGFKTFCPGKKDETRVLSDFSMSVYPGVLYSLLGSSGCGKSTILSCILGLEKLDRGTVSVFGHKHFPMQRMECTQSIGYMPQEVSLYNSLSISETLMYFGTIFSPSYAEGIDKSYLKERSRLLARLLYLPQLSRIVATLSGGQRRRLSFAAALIHEPDLLLLDEPTVGIDPLIRKCMWEYLRTLINTKGTTVIFTTHYIEEANSSDVIGIIKDGRLIAEQSPASLLESHGVHSLEAVYLQLSKLQNTSQTPTESSPIPHEAEGSSLTNRAHWIYKTAVKRIGMLSFLTMMPPACMFIACSSLQYDPSGISFGVVNWDLGNRTKCSNIVNTECSTNFLSCHVLDAFPSEALILNHFENITSARKAVERGDIWGYVLFPANYSSSLVEGRFLRSELISEGYIDGSAIWNDSIITVSMDQSNTFIYGAVQQILFDALEMSSMQLLSACGEDGRYGQFPLHYNEPIVGNKRFTSLNYVAPGLAIGFLLFFPMTVSIRFIDEKRQGTMERCLVGGTKLWEIIVSYAVSELCLVFLQSLLILIVIRYGFSIGDNASSSILSSNGILSVVLCTFQGMSGLAFGLLIGILCKQESQAALTIIAIIFPSTFVSAILWPLEGMPLVLQYVSPMLPMTLPGEALRSVMIRGWGVSHPNVWGGFMVTTIYTAVVIPMTVFITRRNGLRQYY